MYSLKNIYYLLIILVALKIVFYTINMNHRDKKAESSIQKIANKIEYSENNYFIINNNLAQYSSYFIVNNVNGNLLYKIEMLLVKSNRYEKQGTIKDYVCLLKYTNDQIEELIEIKPDRFYLFKHNQMVKLSFNLHLESFKTYLLNPNSFIVKNIVCAAILKTDFDIKLNNFVVTERKSHKKPLVFPYFYIRYQKPTLVYAKEPRLPSVGLCIQNVFQIPSFLELKNWVDYHLSIGLSEIVFYDATPNKTLTKFIQGNYENNPKLIVKPYEKEKFFVKIYQQFKHLNFSNSLQQTLLKIHQYRFTREIFVRADDLTTNDCFGVMRYKHEFIAHYDLDEIIFPRSLDSIKDFYEKRANYNCENSDKICSLNPFKNGKNLPYFYDYLNSLIESERKGRDREKLRSIDFRRTLTIKSNSNVEVKILKDLKTFINKVKSNSVISYPTSLIISLSSTTEGGNKFIINRGDIDYVKYLYNSYENLLQCSLHSYLNNSIYKDKKLDNNLAQFLYFVTEYEMKNKNFKKIHYYKNVYTIFTHWATDFEEDSWTFIPSPLDGHLIHHFRKTWKNKSYVSTDSIRLLNIDFEYLFFLLKNYSPFCKDH
jgi:hypothetical protein